MKFTITYILCLLTINISAQKIETVNWINKNLIEIEDANPNTELIIFDQNIPKKFNQAKIFGFGETTHHGKEFFTIKAKFFKYLVQKKNVKAFLMEESYPAESGINEWISGGKGDLKTIADNFSIYPWHTQEVVDLLKWMRNYNLEKPKNEQIQFYGIDIQFVKGINEEIRDFVKRNGLSIDENLLSTVDKCTNKKNDYKGVKNWADEHKPDLQNLKKIISEFQKNSSKNITNESQDAIRALNYLIDYTDFIKNPTTKVRDLKMFENAQYIIDNLTENGKAFIWAHNEHINNLELLSYGSDWTSLGSHLKNNYKEDYYSVGFDFGSGNLRGYVIEKNKPNHWEVYTIDKPFKRTYSKTLFEADKNIYFIDINKALQDDSINFFDKKEKQLILGGPGFNPEDVDLIPKKFSEMYDGLIFVKRISVPNYNLDGA
ncbi:erythromycin esterase family protein [Christiangramia echinicola]|uniref:Erythromycin esterase n=1 Tax=Christiangramia echinicola TaxID=279359 RepID=A0A1H1L9P0_9FLAO|nr:erythromycin esterase family protein [Christiangramia echinicola]SDR71321.1 erythromycin esterase [Christiangramia echinicola]